MNFSAPHLEIIQALTCLLENAKFSQTVLARWPLQLPAGQRVRNDPIPPLRPAPLKSLSILPHYWPDESLRSAIAPVFIFVIEGETDLSVGVTRQMAEMAQAGEGEVPGRFVLEAAAPVVVVVPPGTPHTDGSDGHWWRIGEPRRDSWLLWMIVLPEGVMIHTCRTKNERHQPHDHVLLSDTAFWPLADVILETLGQRERPILVSMLLKVLVAGIKEALEATAAPRLDDPLGMVRPIHSTVSATGPVALRRASRYIRTHLSEELSVESIARHVQTSPAQLNRLFRAELDLPIMGFVKQCRMENAQLLLTGSSLSILQIAQLCGYRELSAFSRAFTASTGSSPTRFRLQDGVVADPHKEK